MHARWGWACALALVWSVMAGCVQTPRGLTVDLRTDFVPMLEFATVRTEVLDAPFASASPMGNVSSMAALAGGDYVRGVRVDELPELAPGSWYVRVSLVDQSEQTIAHRIHAITLVDRLALPVVITRSCDGVTCPGAMDAANLTECSGGRCVDPRCDADHPDQCPSPACVGDRQCDRATCGIGTCAGGDCLVVSSPSACAGATCGPDFTCVGGDAGVRDAGPGGDMGPPDMGPPDMGPPDMGPPDMGPPDMGPPDMGPPDVGAPDMGPPDMGPPDMGVDAGPTCGLTGLACCTGSTCNAGLVCRARRCTACGASGQPCCTGSACGSGLVCSGGSCTACGNPGQPCCAGSACGAGQTCLGGNCVLCGGDGQACCSGACGPGLGCSPFNVCYCIAYAGMCDGSAPCCGGYTCGTTSLGQICCGTDWQPCPDGDSAHCCGSLLCCNGGAGVGFVCVPPGTFGGC